VKSQKINKCIFKILALGFIFAGLLLILPENHINAEEETCYNTYNSCRTVCEDPNQTPPGQKNMCDRACLMNYSLCKLDVFLDGEERVIGELEANQRLPDFAAYRTCMSLCRHCPIKPYTEPVTDDEVICIDTYNYCKIDCLAEL
jgi:hypothetical protein